MLKNKILFVEVGKGNESIVNYIEKLSNEFQYSSIGKTIKQNDIYEVKREKMLTYISGLLGRINVDKIEIIYFIVNLKNKENTYFLNMVLEAINISKQDLDYDTIVNVVGIIPDMNFCTEDELENIFESYDRFNKAVGELINNTLYIDYNNHINSQLQEEPTDVDKIFANLFNSIFDMPYSHYIDDIDMLRVLKSKGNMIIYELSKDKNNFEEAFEQAQENSIFAKYDINDKLECDCIICSFYNQKYKENYSILNKYYESQNMMSNNNSEKNMMIVTGLKPSNVVYIRLKEEFEKRKAYKIKK